MYQCISLFSKCILGWGYILKGFFSTVRLSFKNKLLIFSFLFLYDLIYVQLFGFFFFFFLLCFLSCGMLVPQVGLKPRPCSESTVLITGLPGNALDL